MANRYANYKYVFALIKYSEITRICSNGNSFCNMANRYAKNNFFFASVNFSSRFCSTSNSFPSMANRYVNDIPALPPLVSGANDGSAPVILQGETLSDEHVAAARLQHRNRKTLSANTPSLATEDEVTASQRRKHIVQSSNFDGPTPAWAQQMQVQHTEQMQALTTKVQEMQDMQDKHFLESQETQGRIISKVQEMTAQVKQVQETQGRIIGFLYRHDQEINRDKNRLRRLGTELIVPLIRLLDGSKPADHGVWFPANDEQFRVATKHQVSLLLSFYALEEGGNAEAKKQRLSSFLGVTIPEA